MEISNISPYCSSGQSNLWTNEKLGINTELSQIAYYISLPKLLGAMRDCYQFDNVSMYDHGLLVSKEYCNIISSLENGIVPEHLPEQLLTLYKTNTLLCFSKMLNYHILHDCGKPLVKTVDEEGKQHFPNHSQVSYNQFIKIYPNNEEEAFMIKHDMDFHSLSISELQDLVQTKYGFSLYLTAWAELLANAQMFNGFESVSFKIKKKKLIKCLKLFN